MTLPVAICMEIRPKASHFQMCHFPSRMKEIVYVTLSFANSVDISNEFFRCYEHSFSDKRMHMLVSISKSRIK